MYTRQPLQVNKQDLPVILMVSLVQVGDGPSGYVDSHGTNVEVGIVSPVPNRRCPGEVAHVVQLGVQLVWGERTRVRMAREWVRNGDTERERMEELRDHRQMFINILMNISIGIISSLIKHSFKPLGDGIIHLVISINIGFIHCPLFYSYLFIFYTQKVPKALGHQSP